MGEILSLAIYLVTCTAPLIAPQECCQALWHSKSSFFWADNSWKWKNFKMVGLKQIVFVHLFLPVLHVLACARDLFFPSWSQPGKLSVDSRKLCSIPSSAVGSRCTDLCHWLFAALLPPVPQPVAPCWRPLCPGAHPCPPLGRSSPDLPPDLPLPTRGKVSECHI